MRRFDAVYSKTKPFVVCDVRKLDEHF